MFNSWSNHSFFTLKNLIKFTVNLSHNKYGQISVSLYFTKGIFEKRKHLPKYAEQKVVRPLIFYLEKFNQIDS